MSALQQAEKQLSVMSRAEKAQLLQWVARDLGDAYPGIESISGVCGEEPCIVRTRIPVWVLEQARRLGASEAELPRSYRVRKRRRAASAGWVANPPLLGALFGS